MATNPQPQPIPTVIDLAQEVKRQYPGQFDDLPDWELGSEIKAQYPDHFGDFDDAFMQSPAMRGAGRIPTPDEVLATIPMPPMPEQIATEDRGFDELGSLLGLSQSESGTPSSPPMAEHLAAEDRGFERLGGLVGEGPDWSGIPNPADLLDDLAGPAAPLNPAAGTLLEGEMGRSRPGQAEALMKAATISPADLLPEPAVESVGPVSRYALRPEGSLGQEPMPSEADAFVRTILDTVNPANAASIMALGGADKFVRAAAAHPRVMGWLRNVPVAREALRKLSEVLIPGGATAYLGLETKDAIDKAIEAYDAGDTEAGAAHVATAIVNGLAAAGGAAATGIRARGAPAEAGVPAAGGGRPGAGGTGPRPSLTPPRPSLTPPRGSEVPSPQELVGPEPGVPAQPAARPSVLEEIINAMEGEGAAPKAAPKTPAPSQPKVKPQPKPAEAASPRTQGQLEPTRKAELVQEKEPPAEKSLLDEIAEAGAAPAGRGAIPKPSGETQVTHGDTTKVTMGPMSDGNRDKLQDRLAGRADVSKGDDGRTEVEFDSDVDADTAVLAVNEALAGPRTPEPPADAGAPLPSDLVPGEPEHPPEPASVEDLIATLLEPTAAGTVEETPTPDELAAQEATEPSLEEQLGLAVPEAPPALPGVETETKAEGEPPSPEELLASLQDKEPAERPDALAELMDEPETVSGKDAGSKDPDYVAKARRLREAYRQTRDELPDEVLSWQDMTRLADEVFGGSIASGAYSSRDAYDALEWAEQQRLADKYGKRPQTPAEAKATLAEITKAGDLMPSQTARTREQVQFQQFSTPPPHAFVMNWLADIGPEDRVLEPSAGTGSQAVWAKARGAKVHVNEISDRRADLLRAAGFDMVTQHDAEQINNILQGQERPTVVVMNPPFSAAGQRGKAKDIQIGARHVEQALKRLAPGGRLVALVGRGMEFGKPAFEDWWARILKQYNVRANVSLSGKLYSKYGTAFDSQLLVIDKTGPTSDGAEIVTGQFESLEEAVDALAEVQATHPEPRSSAVADRRGDRRPGRPGISRPGSGKPEARGLHERGDDLAELLAEGSGESAREAGGAEHESVPTPDELVGSGEPEPTRREHGRPRSTERGGEPVREPAPLEAAEPEAVSGKPQPSKLDDEHKREDGPVFTEYQPHPDTKGFSKHPGTLVESKSMAAVERPAIRYQHSIPDSILNRGKGTVISAVQAETVMLAGQRHEQRLADGRRAGFLLGDGTGVGKGRTLAAIALDNWEKGRRRMAFLSVSKDLMEDFSRDLRDVAGPNHPLTKSLTDLGDVQGKEIELHEGIVFSTYSTFISEKKKENVKRYDQLKNWLGDEPLILFDEGHAAKNAGETGTEDDSKKGSQRAAAVIKLQDDLPRARIVYSSATGATEVENMAYMTRMGIWGQGTSFPGGFASFASAMNEGGVGAMEMVARDLKALGAYVARTISFEGVGYDELIHQATPEQRKMYDAAAKIWQELFQNTEQALKDTEASGRGKAFARSRFYSAQQRFFKALITSFKIPTMLKEVEKAIERDGQVVISLIGTGESATESLVNEALAEGADLNDLDFTPKQAVVHYLNTAFPVQQFEEAEEETEDGRTRRVRRPVLDADGNPVFNAEAVELRDRMIDLLDDIKIPMNPLDQLIMGFEKKYPGKVAELTGRTKRLVTKENKFGAESIDYVRRKKEDKTAKSVNVAEMRLFQAGEKRIAIISDAASTGISLHSDLRSKSQRKRAHFILELGWSADKQMQNFGRTHRSNQASPPRYVLVSSDIGGEKRFSSTIAKRLASLGALTKGQRDATGSGDLSKYNFESQYGTAAVDALYTHLERGEKLPGVDDPAQLLVDMGLVPKAKKGERVRDEWRKGGKAVTTFLNRVMALEFDKQNAVFSAFTGLFEKTVENAKTSGEFDDGVMDLKARSIKVLESNPIHREQLTGAPTYHVKIQAEEKSEPVLWRDVSEMFTAREGEFWRNRKTGKWAFMKQAGHRMDETTGRVLNTYSVWTPAAARNSYAKEDELREHWERGGDIAKGEKSDVAREVKTWWTEALEEIPEYRIVNHNIIAGLITPLWRELRESRAQKLKVMRVTADNGERVVGVVVPQRQVGKILTQLGVFQQVQKPKQVFDHVLSGGSVDLRDRLRLARRKFRGSNAIEVLNASSPQFRYLRTIGAIEEITEFKPRFFIPADPAKGVGVLDNLLKEYPQMAQEKDHCDAV